MGTFPLALDSDTVTLILEQNQKRDWEANGESIGEAGAIELRDDAIKTLLALKKWIEECCNEESPFLWQ